MSVLRELVVKLGFETDTAAAAEAFAVGDLLAESLKKLAESAKEFLLEVIEAPNKLAETAEELEHLSIQTGYGTEALQKMQYAAKVTGVDIESLRFGMKTLSRQIWEAAQGSDKAQDNFRQLGIQFKNADGTLRQPEEVFRDLSDAISHTEDPFKRLALSTRLFGLGAQRLMPLLQKGTGFFDEMGKHAEQFGYVLDHDTIESAVQFNQVLHELDLVMQGVWKTIGVAMLPILREVRDATLEWWKANSGLVRGVLTKVVTAIGKAFLAVYRAIRLLIEQWKVVLILGASVAVVLGAQAIAAQLLALGFTQVGAAAVFAGIRAAAAWVLAGLPVFALIAGIVLLILILEDLWVSLHGGKGVIKDLWDIAVAETMKFGIWIEDYLKGVFSRIWHYFTDGIVKDFQGFISWASALGHGGPFFMTQGATPGGTVAAAIAGGGGSGGGGQVNATFATTINATSSDPNAIANASHKAMDEHLNKHLEEAWIGLTP